METHSSILSWRIPETEEPGGLQFMGSQKVGHDWVTSTYARADILQIFIIELLVMTEAWKHHLKEGAERECCSCC